MSLTKNEVLNLIGEFTWFWGNLFFIETDQGNFVWSDPDYPGGDNTIKPWKGDYKSFRNSQQVSFGRDKGKHRIGDYCGENVVFLSK